jgi:SAM-dependent methyltransferase
LAEWWPILSAPEDYVEEAAFYQNAILGASTRPAQTLLELGSGGGNNASHLKKRFDMTLVDISPGMLAVSKALNPECNHLIGDMRTLRLESTFDVVMIHDAIVYMTTEEDLRSAMKTAYIHCKPGGVALFAPDHTHETFRSSTDHGGHDRDQRSLRYLEWTWDPNPDDNQYQFYMVYLIREGPELVQAVLDKHNCGLFSNSDWLKLLSEVGFQPRLIPFEHSQVEPGSAPVFLGIKPTK